MPAQFTIPPDTRAVGTGNPPADMNAVVDAITAMGAPGNVLNAAYAGGADPTGAAACDAAFAACVTAALASGQPVIIPPGTYKTAAALNWKASGLVVRAPGGPDNTTISCTGSNIPVAQFAGSYQDISGLTFTYATPQTSGQTAANVITFGDDTAGSCYQGNYHELNLLNGQTGMAIDPGVTTVAGLFSCRLANIHVGNVSSSFISLIGNNNLGVANCTGCVFDNIYLDYTGGTLAGLPVLMKNWEEFVFNQLNIEHCTVTTQDVLNISVTANAVFNALHFEALTTSLNGGALLHLSGAGTTVINGMSSRFNVYTGSASNPVAKFFGTGPTTLILNGYNEAGCTVTTPSHPLIDFGTATNCVAQVTGQTGTQATVTSVNAGAGDVVQVGVPAAAGIQPVTAGWTCWPTGYGVDVLNNTSMTSSVMVAGTIYYTACYIGSNCTLTGIMLGIGTTAGTDSWIAVLYSSSGATLASSALAGTAVSATVSSKQKFAFTSPFAVTGPGLFHIGVQSNGTTAKFQSYPNLLEAFASSSKGGNAFGTLTLGVPATTYSQSTGPVACTY